MANGGDMELLADRDALALAQDQAAPEGELDYEFYDWAVKQRSGQWRGLGS